MAKKLRKQRVALRFRRREQIKSSMRVALTRSVLLALVVGVGIGAAAGNNSVLAKFLARHTPQLVVDLPPALTGLAVQSGLPKNHLWLWLPGFEVWANKRICREFTAVREVSFERFLDANKVVVHVAPRVPLVIWGGMGFDNEGVLFPMLPNAWKDIPQASFIERASKQELARWLSKFSAIAPVWSQVVALKQDPYGSMHFSTKTGAVVIWGAMELEGLSRKAQTLASVLDDAHTHLGGTALADLRFFDQGRIIVRAKSAN